MTTAVAHKEQCVKKMGMAPAMLCTAHNLVVGPAGMFSARGICGGQEQIQCQQIGGDTHQWCSQMLRGAQCRQHGLLGDPRSGGQEDEAM